MNTQAMNNDSFQQVKQILVGLHNDLTKLNQEAKATPKITGLLQNLNALMPIIKLYEDNNCELNFGFLSGLVSHALTLQSLLSSKHAILESKDISSMTDIKFALLLKNTFEKLAKLENPTGFLKTFPTTVSFGFISMPIPYAEEINARIKDAQKDERQRIQECIDHYNIVLINSSFANNIINNSDIEEKIMDLKKEMNATLRKINNHNNPNDIQTIQACIELQTKTKNSLEQLLNENKDIHDIMKIQNGELPTMLENELATLTTSMQDDTIKLEKLTAKKPRLEPEDVMLLENSIITRLEPALQHVEIIDKKTAKLITMCEKAIRMQLSKNDLQSILELTQTLFENFELEKVNFIKKIRTCQAMIENINPRINSSTLDEISKKTESQLEKINQKIELLSTKENAFGFFQRSPNQDKPGQRPQTSPTISR